MDKQCNHCKKNKSLDEFFSAPYTGAASWQGTSANCIKCHDAGSIPHGYGAYGDKWKSPDFNVMTGE